MKSLKLWGSLMAISRVIKTLNNLSKAFSDIDDDFFREGTKEYGEEIQGRLLDGISGGYDIEGKTFKGLRESTLNIREKFKGTNRTSPLRESGGLVDFLNSSDLVQTGKVQLTLKKAPEEYLVHNEDHSVPSSKFADKLNLTGKSVPARKWYGIPKTYREGGTKYELFLSKIIKKITTKIARVINEG